VNFYLIFFEKFFSEDGIGAIKNVAKKERITSI
jgi:hypothetical protein